MTRIVLLTVVLAAAAGIGYATHPVELTRFADVAAKAALRAWGNVEANPIPVYIAVGTFVLTVVYLRAKGKTLRESVQVAATRVSVVPVPAKRSDEDETPVVKRAKARATRAQLLADQIGLQNRTRHLPEAIRAAEKETCYTEQSVLDVENAIAAAERALETKQKAHDDAVAKLEALRKEKAACDAELGAIEVELKKLNALV